VKLNGDGKITATGTVPRPEVTIAANLKFFKPGTLVRIKETGMVGRIEDTGAAMRKNPYHIDIFTKSKEVAENWGVRKVTLEILAKN
jgi:3D (Asp-Asp-Asp) domain-containing protein